jgi:hypothetical protein
LIKQIYTLRTKTIFGRGFWIQWLAITIIVGLGGLFSAEALLGDQSSNSASGVMSFLYIGIAIGLAQWFLRRSRAATNIWSLMGNIFIVLISFVIAILLL